MNIRYRKFPDETRPEGYSYAPLLQIFLRRNMNLQPVLALVDSGASDCIFPASVGELLGIDILTGKSHKFYSYESTATDGYLHRVSLQVQGFPHWIEVDAVFIQSEVMPIVGQAGFFENYQLVFERYSQRFEVNTKTDAIIRTKQGRGRGRVRGRRRWR